MLGTEIVEGGISDKAITEEDARLRRPIDQRL